MGLFGGNAGTIQNVTLANTIVIGQTNDNGVNVGGLVGRNYVGGSVINSGVSGGVVTGPNIYQHVGGLVGENDGTIENSYSSALVSAGPGVNNNGYYTFGGLAGSNFGQIGTSFATGAVSGDSGDGGAFVGKNNGTIAVSFVTGSAAGGIGGANDSSIIGGLVGWNQGGQIAQSYALGAVDGGSGGTPGGFVQLEDSGGQILQSYSIGRVPNGGGGFVQSIGYGGGNVVNSYWDTDTSGQPTVSVAGTGISDSALKSSSLPSGFDPSTWNSGLSNPNLNNGYPYLSWQTAPPFDVPDASLRLKTTNYTFAPIGQLDPSQYSVDKLTQKFNNVATNSWEALYASFITYRTNPNPEPNATPYNINTGAGAACLATDLAMIARAVGTTTYNPYASSATIDVFQDLSGNGFWPTPNTQLAATLGKVTFTSVRGTSSAPSLARYYKAITPETPFVKILELGPIIGHAVNDKANDPSGHYVLITRLINSNGVTYLVANDPLLGLQIRFPYTNRVIKPISEAYNPAKGTWIAFTKSNSFLIQEISKIEPERFATNFNELCGCIARGSRPYVPETYEAVTIN